MFISTFRDGSIRAIRELRRAHVCRFQSVIFFILRRTSRHFLNFNLFEGVSVTTVILAPGACGMGGPSCGSCHHLRPSGRSRRVFPKRRSCAPAADFRAREVPKPGLAHNRVPEGPVGSSLDEIETQLGPIYIHKLPINRPSGRYVSMCRRPF